MDISFKLIGQQTLDKRLKQLKDRSAQIPAFANKVLFPMYQNLQRKRWQSEGRSEGFSWKPLNAKYAKRKRVKFASSPGRGTKMLIASGRLFSSVIEPSSGDFRKIVTPRYMTIATRLSYAPFVARVRPIMLWGPESKKLFRDAIKDFMSGGNG